MVKERRAKKTEAVAAKDIARWMTVCRFARSITWRLCCAAFMISLYVSFMLTFMFSSENGVFAELSTLFFLAIAAIAVSFRWALPCFVGVWVI